MKAAKLLKLADFLEKLPRRKLDMCIWGNLNGSEKLDPHRCKSAACALGWATVVFPRELELIQDINGGKAHVIHKKTGGFNLYAAGEMFDLDFISAEYLFYPRHDYYTPKQVARGIRQFVEKHEKG